MVGDMLVPSRVFVCWVKTPCWFFGGILTIFTSFYFTKDQTFRLGIKVRKRNWHNVRICGRWVLDLIAGHILVGLIPNIKYIFISGATYVQVAVIPKDFSKETTRNLNHKRSQRCFQNCRAPFKSQRFFSLPVVILREKPAENPPRFDKLGNAWMGYGGARGSNA